MNMFTPQHSPEWSAVQVTAGPNIERVKVTQKQDETNSSTSPKSLDSFEVLDALMHFISICFAPFMFRISLKLIDSLQTLGNLEY